MIEDSQYWTNRTLNDPRRDWAFTYKNWVQDYWNSIYHPHRKEIIREIKKLSPIYSILELGCNCGVNLKRIHDALKPLANLGKLSMIGIDINKDAIESGIQKFKRLHYRKVDLIHANFIEKIKDFEDGSFDLVLADAALIYINPNEIEGLMRDICRVSKKAVILVEWFADSELGVIKDFHWARDYCQLLKKYGFDCKARKLTLTQWPSKNWYTNGCIFTAVRK